MSELDLYFVDKKLDKIFEKGPDLIRFKANCEKIQYFKEFANKNRQEEFLYETYYQTLKIAGTSMRTFDNFKPPNYDMFQRLKWKWLNSIIFGNG